MNQNLLDKARARGKGVAEELKRLKNAIPETNVTDAALHAYITHAELTIKDIQADVTSVPIKLAAGRLRKRLAQVIADTEPFAGDVTQIPDPNALRSDITAAVNALHRIDARIEASNRPPA